MAVGEILKMLELSSVPDQVSPSVEVKNRLLVPGRTAMKRSLPAVPPNATPLKPAFPVSSYGNESPVAEPSRMFTLFKLNENEVADNVVTVKVIGVVVGLQTPQYVGGNPVVLSINPIPDMSP